MRGGAGVAVAQDSPRCREFFRLPQSLSFFSLSFYSLSILQGLDGFAARFRARLSISRPALDFPRATRCPARYPIYGARLVLWDAQTTPCDAQEDASCLRRTP